MIEWMVSFCRIILIALILGIDHYVAKIISDAVNKAIKTSAIQTEI
jgi:hypothetical protein